MLISCSTTRLYIPATWRVNFVSVQAKSQTLFFDQVTYYDALIAQRGRFKHRIWFILNRKNVEIICFERIMKTKTQPSLNNYYSWSFSFILVLKSTEEGKTFSKISWEITSKTPSPQFPSPWSLNLFSFQRACMCRWSGSSSIILFFASSPSFSLTPQVPFLSLGLSPHSSVSLLTHHDNTHAHLF